MSLADIYAVPNSNLLEEEELLNHGDSGHLQRCIVGTDAVIPTPTTLRLEHILLEGLNLLSNKSSHSVSVILYTRNG